jgi:dTDP-4-dehydrorhamnose 3,5-epimerase|tara:strand:+ start:5715 stop:6275 length:561 start_codon:yes stop_codon:yes gene_type:complete
MKTVPTKIDGLMIIEPKVHHDKRGYFFESFRSDIMTIKKYKFVQENESFSSKGALRGLHFQLPPFVQAKLVRVVSGSVYDVAVDLRIGSPTFGKWHGEILSGENKRQFLIPEGFAHGFITLQDNTIFQYKCTNYYSSENEGGISYRDNELNINWSAISGIPEIDFLLTQKDKDYPLLNNFNSPFIF